MKKMLTFIIPAILTGASISTGASSINHINHAKSINNKIDKITEDYSLEEMTNNFRILSKWTDSIGIGVERETNEVFLVKGNDNFVALNVKVTPGWWLNNN
ncbi:hypothetical protein D6D54_01410 [Spiroplasma poulsonii]|uniref:Uncharacterized protein n=1 Tax=Spiroplasma poulsonii TaxID=2138 RepID=A0A3S0UNM0_9MOLU|nr:hypothetical protein [Spiroplasma poulsonii]MBW3058034.1 hypothetical protein [Spiroplasma poulsonii]RUP78152.1 hypothetical protein D6D54_01410 [Spiroplasma poulsonii]